MLKRYCVGNVINMRTVAQFALKQMAVDKEKKSTVEDDGPGPNVFTTE